jgi:class 3 adenylate cyclase
MQSFIALIDRLNACAAAERREIERHIATTFEIECAVLALDMSGYSSSVRRNGIVPHLCRIRQMQLLVRPIVEQFGGQIVRELADNILAVFPSAAMAVDAAFAVRDAAMAFGLDSPDAESNHDCPDWSLADNRLHVSIGIDHGKLLLIPGHDCFGDPVNVAFKLGEDLAGAGEILVSDNILQHQADRFSEGEITRIAATVSGIDVLAYKLHPMRGHP